MRLSRRMKWTIAAGAAVLLLLLPTLRPDVVEVDLVVVERGPMAVTVDEEGMTHIRDHAMVAAPITGRLQASWLEPGDTVALGDIVARIAPVPLDARAVEQAEAALAEARSRRAAAEAQVDQAIVALGQATRDRERGERLAAAGAIAERDVEALRTDERIRIREVEAARAAAAAAAGQERGAQGSLLGSAASNAPAAQVVVRSPLSGQVLRLVEEDARVVAAGTALLEVGTAGDIEVVIDVLSSDASRIEPGTPVVVRIPRGGEHTAHVARVEPAAFTKVSPLGVEEQRVNVIARLDGPVAGLGHRFRVLASIVTWHAEAVLSVPSISLVPIAEGWGVYVVRDGRARLRPVTLGQQGAREVEITAGLDEGDVVVRHPDERIREGTRVGG